jgi:hypothetical protein
MKTMSDILHDRQEGVGVKMKTMSDIVMAQAEPPRYVWRSPAAAETNALPPLFSPVMNRIMVHQSP